MQKYFDCSDFVDVALKIDIKANHRTVVINAIRKNDFYYYVDLKYKGRRDEWRSWIENNNDDRFCMYYIPSGGRQLIFFRKAYDAMAFKLTWI